MTSTEGTTTENTDAEGADDTDAEAFAIPKTYLSVSLHHPERMGIYRAVGDPSGKSYGVLGFDGANGHVEVTMFVSDEEVDELIDLLAAYRGRKVVRP